jgi:hypothetical protein
MRSKRGSLETKEIIELILAAAFIVIIAILLWNLISPEYSEGEETAKSYLKSFKVAVAEADRNGKASFNFWKGKLAMAYFGDNRRADFGEYSFLRKSAGDNALCFCYDDDPSSRDWDCDECVSLDKPVEFRTAVNAKVPKDTIDQLFFFDEDKYWKYDNYHYNMLQGYPRDISDASGWPGVPSELDAAVRYSEGVYYFFKGDEYWRYDYNPANNVNKAGSAVKISDASGWPGLPSDIDAAVRGLGDKIYFFKGDDYWRYDYNPSTGVNKLISPVSGQKISDEWEGLPLGFEPDAAVRFRDYVYFFKGDDYWKYDLVEDKAIEDYPASTDSWGSDLNNMDAAAQGFEVNYRSKEYGMNIFTSGCRFDIFSISEKYIFEVNCDYLADGK